MISTLDLQKPELCPNSPRFEDHTPRMPYEWCIRLPQFRYPLRKQNIFLIIHHSLILWQKDRNRNSTSENNKVITKKHFHSNKVTFHPLETNEISRMLNLWIILVVYSKFSTIIIAVDEMFISMGTLDTEMLASFIN